MYDILVHTDWGKDAKKRWSAVARRHGETWRLSEPEPHWPAARLLNEATNRSVLAGFDFPIGVPMAWARKIDANSFIELLPRLGLGEWDRFFDVAERRDQISVFRPFYPHAPGGKSQAHLTEAHRVGSINELKRQCELRVGKGASACPMFWTLGGNQVGKGAIAGWREIVQPAVAARAMIWPFQSTLSQATIGLTLAETYPAEAYGHVGVKLGPKGKRDQATRAEAAQTMLRWAARTGVVLEPSLLATATNGFGPEKSAEDPFDALLGLCGMIEVVSGRRPHGAPDTADVRLWEGWILGKSPAAGMGLADHIDTVAPPR